MPPTLAIGDRAYSSWSLRGWLLFEAFGLPVRTERAQIYTDALPALLARFAPARTVPALRLDDGTVVADTLAIAEELASRHPEAGIWPDDPAARALARMMAAEMHSSYPALRQACAMDLRRAYAGFEPPADALADLRRIEALWAWAQDRHGGAGPWLFGAYSAADAFYAPVAARVASYGLPIGPAGAAYVARHLAHGPFRRWRAMAQVDGPDQTIYHLDLPLAPWPGPAPLAARAVAAGPSVNAACPYSGKAVTDFLMLDGKTYGFCNPFCRDKTAADPAAWPAFMAITA